MFSGVIEKGHWLHFLMTLKENTAANGLTGKDTYFNKFQLYYYLKIFSSLYLLQETIRARMLVNMQNSIYPTKFFH